MKKTATISLLLLGSLFFMKASADVSAEDLAWESHDAVGFVEDCFEGGHGGEDDWENCWDDLELCRDHEIKFCGGG